MGLDGSWLLPIYYAGTSQKLPFIKTLPPGQDHHPRRDVPVPQRAPELRSAKTAATVGLCKAARATEAGATDTGAAEAGATLATPLTGHWYCTNGSAKGELVEL